MPSSGLVNAFETYFRLIILAVLEDIKIFLLLFIEFAIPNPSFVYLKSFNPLCVCIKLGIGTNNRLNLFMRVE